MKVWIQVGVKVLVWCYCFDAKLLKSAFKLSKKMGLFKYFHRVSWVRLQWFLYSILMILGPWLTQGFLMVAVDGSATGSIRKGINKLW